MLKSAPLFRSMALAAGVLGLLMATAQAQPAPTTTAGGDVVKIDADHQTYDAAGKKYTLSGNVSVIFHDMLVKSSDADLDVDDQGQPQVANFYHRPEIKRTVGQNAQDDIRGDVVHIYLSTNQFGVEGNVDAKLASADNDPFVIHSDSQTFDNTSKLITAAGNVHVNYKDSMVTSNNVMMRMKDDGKADRIVFTGGAHINKEDSKINSEKITIMGDSGNLIAENHVNTEVDMNPPKDGTDKVIVQSDYQEYDKASDKMIASGHVHLLMGDYTADGGKATFNLSAGQMDHILLTGGRPTITDSSRTITADKITITTSPRHFDAVGNVQIRFKTQDPSQQPLAATPAPAAKPAAKPPARGIRAKITARMAKKPAAAPAKPAPQPAAAQQPKTASPEDDELKY